MAISIVAPGGANPPANSVTVDAGLSGIQIVPASLGCFYPPAIDGSDLLQVDFDTRQVKQNGLYLVELVQHGVVVWRGARRFEKTARSLNLDDSGDGCFRGIASAESLGLRVVGFVLEVYKPARRIAEMAAALRRAV